MKDWAKFGLFLSGALALVFVFLWGIMNFALWVSTGNGRFIIQPLGGSEIRAVKIIRMDGSSLHYYEENGKEGIVSGNYTVKEE